MGPLRLSCTRVAVSGWVEATTTAVGIPRATSSAKLGPESTAIGWPTPISSAITCDIRSSESVSRPLVALTRIAPLRSSGAALRSTWRMPCDGTAAMTIGASASVVSSEAVAVTLSPIRIAGRYPEFSRVRAISSISA